MNTENEVHGTNSIHLPTKVQNCTVCHPKIDKNWTSWLLLLSATRCCQYTLQKLWKLPWFAYISAWWRQSVLGSTTVHSPGLHTSSSEHTKRWYGFRNHQKPLILMTICSMRMFATRTFQKVIMTEDALICTKNCVKFLYVHTPSQTSRSFVCNH